MYLFCCFKSSSPLAGWQVQKSIDFLRYNLEEEIPLETKEEADLALAC